MVLVKQRWRKRPVCCSFAFAAAAVFLLIFGGVSLWLFWLAALVHELGHLTVLRLLRGRVEQLCFRLSGAEIRYGGCRLSYGGEVVLALAGPVTNLLCALLCGLAVRWHPAPWLYRFIGCHLILAAFNLLPALPMDGGRILQALLEWHVPLRGEAITTAVSFMLGGLLTLMGTAMFLKSRNLTLFTAGLVILHSSARKSTLHLPLKLLK